MLENVVGLFSSNRGRDFGRLIREVESLGYGLAWRTLDARWFGVAQRRRRVFIVAARDDAFGGLGADRAAEVLIECEGVCGHLAAGESAGKKTSERARSGTVVGHAQHPAAHSDGMRAVDGMAGRLDDREGVEDSRRVGNFKLYDFPPEAIAPTINARRAKDELVYGGGPFSFPSRFGSNAQVTADIAQSFAHSAGAPAVLRTGTSYDGFNQRLEPDGPHRTLRIGRDSSDFVVPPNGIPEDDDPFNPIGLDSNRYRCIGNGVVAPVAEFIGRRIVAVDAKHWKETNG